MKMTWHGQACFTLKTASGVSIRLDPFDESLGLPVPTEPADLVLVSHDHFDHNAVSVVPGKPDVIKSVRKRELKGVRVAGVQTFHDESHGSERGENRVFVVEADDVRVVHLGDLGHVLADEQIAAIGRVDVLMLPVGGTYTIDAAHAWKVVEQLAPRIVIPMHFKLPDISLPIAGPDDFLRHAGDVVRLDDLDLTPETLPASQQVVLLQPRA